MRGRTATTIEKDQTTRLTRNLIRLAAPLCLAVALASGGHAEAAFDVTTSIFKVTGATNEMSGGGMSLYNIGGVNGEYITLTDFSRKGNTSAVTPAESIGLSGSPQAGVSITVILNIFVTDPSNSANFLTFQEDANYNLVGGNLFPNPASPATIDTSTFAAQQTLNGTIYTISAPVANEVDYPQTNATAITALITPSSATVPEPASIALLGLGLLGAGGLTLLRRRAR